MTYEKFMEQVKEQIMSFLPEEYANADVTIQTRRLVKIIIRNFMQYVLNVQRTELFPMFILKIIIGHMRMMGIWKIF